MYPLHYIGVCAGHGKEELHMNEMALKYGCNPNQKIAKVYMKDGKDLPFTVLNGRPGFINLLDAFNSWQLVKELVYLLRLPLNTSARLAPQWPRS